MVGYRPGRGRVGYWPPPHIRPASDIWWSLWETCSNLFIWGPLPKWHLVMDIEACMVGTSGQYASYWNAFLFLLLTPVALRVSCYLTCICSEKVLSTQSLVKVREKYCYWIYGFFHKTEIVGDLNLRLKDTDCLIIFHKGKIHELSMRKIEIMEVWY